MAIDVKSYTDRKSNKVQIGDRVGYFRFGTDTLLAEGTVRRITKAGGHIEVFIEGRPHSWSTVYIEKITNDQTKEGGEKVDDGSVKSSNRHI